MGKLLNIALFLFFFFPPLIFSAGRLNGNWIFTSYREPKLAACQVLAWLLISSFWLNWAVNFRDNKSSFGLKGVLNYKWFWLLIIFISYLAWTMNYALVKEIAIYEFLQYLTILNLVFVLIVLYKDEFYLKVTMWAIAISFFLVTLIGLFQLYHPIGCLIPISKKYYFTSTFGYKNPMALALLGQIFLLCSIGVRLLSAKRWPLLFFLILAIILEVIYLGMLGSRTSYFAFILATLFSLGLSTLILFKTRRFKWIATAIAFALCCLITIGVVLYKNPVAHRRLNMMLPYLKSPSLFLKSDRGTYLLNSIHMANKNLFGVGIGNWGYGYAELRKYRPRFLFNKRVQVRRAHGDYAQMLGESGWPGLVIWSVLLLWTLFVGIKDVFIRASMEDAFYLTQFFAFCVAMATDYCIEMPYHKFAFFAVMAIIHARYLWAVEAREGIG